MSEPAGTPRSGPVAARPRLFALLDEGARRQVTLVRAGPGWGKSTLVRSWAAGRPGPYACLILKPAHRAVRALRAAVAAVLEPAGVVIIDGCAERSPHTVTLVLDDLEVLDGSP